MQYWKTLRYKAYASQQNGILDQWRDKITQLESHLAQYGRVFRSSILQSDTATGANGVASKVSAKQMKTSSDVYIIK
jgi:hypothetical protein